MDWRLYILAGAVVLFVAALFFLVSTIVGAARARAREARQGGAVRMVLPPAIVTLEPDPTSTAAPGPDDREARAAGEVADAVEAAFSEPAEPGDADPILTGDWHPDASTAQSPPSDGPEGAEAMNLDELEPDLRELAASLDESSGRPPEGPYRARVRERRRQEEEAAGFADEPVPTASDTIEELLAQLEALGLSVTPRAARAEQTAVEEPASVAPAPAPAPAPVAPVPAPVPAPVAPAPAPIPAAYPVYAACPPIAYPPMFGAYPYPAQYAIVPGQPAVGYPVAPPVAPPVHQPPATPAPQAVVPTQPAPTAPPTRPPKRSGDVSLLVNILYVQFSSSAEAAGGRSARSVSGN